MSYGNKPNEIRHPQAACLLEEYTCQRIQSLGYSADLNSEEVFQLTDENVVEVVDSDPNVTVTLDVNEFGSINVINQLAGFNDYPTHATNNTNATDGTVSHTDFGSVATDIIIPIKESQTATEPTRTLWFNNCFIDSISGTYQVDGFATESISMSGAAQTWFLNSLSGVQVGIPVFVTTSHLDVTHSSLSGEVYGVTEDGVRLSDSYWGHADGNAGDITSKGGYSFGSSKRYRYLWNPTSASFPTISDDANPVGGVREGEIEIVLWDPSYMTEPAVGNAGTIKLLRAQSVDYELSFDREDLKQLYTGTYHKGLNDINISTTITLVDSDLELWAMTSGKGEDYTNSTADFTTMALTDFQSMSNLGLRIDVFNTKDYLEHSTVTLLKQLKFEGGKVTSVNDSRDVPGRGTQTFEIEFTKMHYHGTGNVGR